MHPHHPPTIVERWFVFGPLLYLAAMMVIDPAGVLRAFAHLSHTLRTLERRLQGFPMPETHLRAEPSGSAVLMRIAGAVLALWAMLPLTGVVN